MSSRCSFPKDHPLFQGFLNPEQRSIAAAIERYDLVLVFGAPVFTHHVSRGAAEQSLPELFVLSDDDDLLAQASHGTGIRTMLRPALRQLSELVAKIDRLVIVAVIGDGSSMYGIQALWTAVREHLPATFVIVDNSQYAALKILAGLREALARSLVVDGPTLLHVPVVEQTRALY